MQPHSQHSIAFLKFLDRIFQTSNLLCEVTCERSMMLTLENFLAEMPNLSSLKIPHSSAISLPYRFLAICKISRFSLHLIPLSQSLQSQSSVILLLLEAVDYPRFFWSNPIKRSPLWQFPPYINLTTSFQPESMLFTPAHSRNISRDLNLLSVS